MVIASNDEGSSGGETMRKHLAGLILIGLGVCGPAGAQEAKDLLNTLLQREQAASVHRGHYEYMSEERSDRTGGQLWRERVVETPVGRIRFLIAVDGVAIDAARVAAERGRLAQDVAHPDDFAAREAAQKSDEQHAKNMLQLLPKAFLFDPPALEGEYVRVRFRPNPDYQPQGIEERVLHGMTGSVLIDRQAMRLREVDGRLDGDVSLGFGPFAVVKAGSNFATQREHEDGDDWKTETVHTDINGKALMLKTLARKQELKRWGYKKVADGLNVAEGVALVELP